MSPGGCWVRTSLEDGVENELGSLEGLGGRQSHLSSAVGTEARTLYYFPHPHAPGDIQEDA